MKTIITFLLLSSVALAQGVDGYIPQPDMRVEVGNCTYEIGQRSAVEGAWACVMFSPVSVGGHPSLQDAAQGCQNERGEDKHALWGNYIVLWPIDCGTPIAPMKPDFNQDSTGLSWDAPTTNECGEPTLNLDPEDINYCPPLDDLAGYKVYCNDRDPVSIDGPDNLSWGFPADLYGLIACAVTALDETGNESRPSNMKAGYRDVPGVVTQLEWGR